jgi:ketosteroid isomerase-like protein
MSVILKSGGCGGKAAKLAMTSKQTILAFIDRINAHDVQGLGELMSADHTFIDAHGNQVSGKEKMIAGWRGYFEWFPDYHIEVTDQFQQGDNFALFGFAGGTFKNQEGESWRLPAAWKAIVKDDRVSLWQVFADTKIPFEIIERNS